MRFIKYMGLMCLLFAGMANAQDLPPILAEALKLDTAYQKIACDIRVEVDVPGLQMPDKAVSLELERGKEPKVKGEGLLLIPKKGMMGQFKEITATPLQTIAMGERGDTLQYKLVALDPNSSWITVDVHVTKTDYKIHQLLINTRKNGTFVVHHYYGFNKSTFPVLTVIAFETMPLKLPMKFMGNSSGAMEGILNSDEPVTGKVKLHYSNVVAE